MGDKVLMKISGSKLLSNTWKQELQIREDGVYGEVLVVGRRVQMFLPYKDIAQVNVVRGVLTSMLMLINKGGEGNLSIEALNKGEADKAKALIQQKIKEHEVEGSLTEHGSGAIEKIERLHALLKSGALTEDEFKIEKAKVLNESNRGD